MKEKKLLPTVLLVSLVFTACFFVNAADSSSSRATEKGDAMAVFYKAIPPLGVKGYDTLGVYPRLTRHTTSLEDVNRIIKKTFLNDERRFARTARKWNRTFPDKNILQRYRGLYRVYKPLTNGASTGLGRGVITTEKGVVSILSPKRSLVPGGTAGQSFVAVTALVPSGAKVELPSLFSNRKKGMQALASVVRRLAYARNPCVAKLRKTSWRDGFAPRTANYRLFAFTHRGLAIGIPADQVAPSVCNSFVQRVPYRTLRPYFTKLGIRIIAEVEKARPRSG